MSLTVIGVIAVTVLMVMAVMVVMIMMILLGQMMTLPSMRGIAFYRRRRRTSKSLCEPAPDGPNDLPKNEPGAERHHHGVRGCPLPRA